MGKLGRSILRGHMLARVASIAALLVLMAIWYTCQDTSPVVERRPLHGTVTRLGESFMEVKLETGQTTTLMTPTQLKPRVGARVPVTIEVQESGEQRAYFDQDRWIGAD